jgi:hypothetical protein
MEGNKDGADPSELFRAYRMPFLASNDIEGAKGHKHIRRDDNIAAQPFLHRYWNWGIEFVPVQIALNLIPFVRFLFQATSVLISFVLPGTSRCAFAS